MKTKMKIAAFYLLAVLAGGCVPSLHPLFTENELVFNANLVGKWSEPNSSDYWEFKATNNKKYNFIYTDKKGKGIFDGRLGKIGNNTFLDIYPTDMNLPGNDFYKSHLLGTHSFMKIDLSKDGLKIGIMNPDNIKKLVNDEPNAIKYEKIDDRIVLTDSTKELQAFVLKYGMDEKLDLFGKKEDTTLLHRVNVQEANEPENKELNQPR